MSKDFKYKFLVPVNYSVVSKVFNEVVDVFMGQGRTTKHISIIKHGLSLRSHGVFKNLITRSEREFDSYIVSTESMQNTTVMFMTNLIVFLEATMENLRHYRKYYKFDGRDASIKSIMYIDDSSLKDIEESGRSLKELDLFKNIIYSKTYFVINRRYNVFLATFEWFSEQMCNKPHFMILNAYDKNSGKWDYKLQKHEKFMDYYGCELVLFLPTLRPPYYLYSWGFSEVNYFKTNFTVHGIIPKLFRIASKKFNFIAEFQPANVYSNNSFLANLDIDSVKIIRINGIFKEPTVCIEYSAWSSIFNTPVVGTYPFDESVMYLLVTPAEEYTPYEKLLLPFDEETWIMLVITFTLAFCAIIIINKLSRKVQNVFYGSRVKTPLLNLISIFFGISQTQLPSGNFSRQILILFVYFCLIFRTCFQSKMFEFMTSHPTHPPPKTIQDLVDKNYTVYTKNKSVLEIIIRQDIHMWPQIKELTNEQYDEIYESQSKNSSAKIALEIQNTVRIKEMIQTEEDDEWLRLNQDCLLVIHGTFGMRAQSFYFNMIAKTVNGLRDTGVLKYLIDWYVGILPKFSQHVRGPEILTLDNLAFGFNIWLGSCFATIVCFVTEVFIFKVIIFCSYLSRKGVKYAKVCPTKKEKRENIRINEETLKIFRIQKVKPLSEELNNCLEQNSSPNLSLVSVKALSTTANYSKKNHRS